MALKIPKVLTNELRQKVRETLEKAKASKSNFTRKERLAIKTNFTIRTRNTPKNLLVMADIAK